MGLAHAMADISQTAANFITSANATIAQNVAGATLTRGLPLYLDGATGTVKAFVANDTAKDQFYGLSCEDVGAGQQVLVVTKDPALQLGGTVAIGDTIWASATGLTKTFADLVSTWRVWVMGVCNASSNVINFNPVKGGIKP